MPPKKAAVKKDPPPPKVTQSKDGLKELIVILDTQIVNQDYGAAIISQIAENHIRYQVRNQLIEMSISFERNPGDPVFGEPSLIEEENVMLLILRGSDVIRWIDENTLISTIRSQTEIYPDKKFSLVIYGLRKYFRGTNTKLSRVKIETELSRLQLHTRFSHRLIEKASAVADCIVHFGKAVAEIPMKKLKNAKLESENFYFANDSKDCVKVSGTAGLGRLWQQHLIKLPMITLETAEAIMSVYPMPRDLFDAFKTSSDPENLLKDIPIRRGAGALSSSRRIGPEMSRKIYEFYHVTDPQHLLN